MNAWHHPPRTMCGGGEEGGGKSDETSRICCDHVNFPEMNGRDKFIRQEGVDGEGGGQN